jgi:hypothetical protein
MPPLRVSRAVARALTCGILAAAGLGRTARAQDEPIVPSPPIPSERHGLTLSLGTGAGIGNRSCRRCATGRLGGPTGYARLGFALGSHFTVGGEVDGFTNTDDRGFLTVVTFAYTTAYLQWYPFRTDGFFLKIHAGTERTRIAVGEISQPKVVTNGSGSAFGASAGHDVRVSPNTSLTPFFALFTTSHGEGTRAGRPIGAMNSYLFQIGLGLTRH